MLRTIFFGIKFLLKPVTGGNDEASSLSDKKVKRKQYLRWY